MVKDIKLGRTKLEELHEVFKISKDDLESRKARLFPTGNSEQEVSTTSIFLASLSAVKEYRQFLLSNIGINKVKIKTAQVHVYTEMCDNGKTDRPDGLIIVTSGVRTPIIEWACFVEAKVGNNLIDQKQIDRYIDFGKSIGIDNLLSISNQLVPTPFDSPVSTKKKVQLYHWSWTYLKVMALYLVRNGVIEDEDHHFILKELRRFMDAHRNLKNFIDMGATWKEDVSHILTMPETQKVPNKIVDSITSVYSQEEKDLSLQLTDNSNYFIELLIKKDRLAQISTDIAESRYLTSTYSINSDKKNIFDVEVNFKNQSITCTYKMAIDKGKAQAQTTRLLHFLEGVAVPDDILIKAVYPRNRTKSEQAEIAYSKLLLDKEESAPYSLLDKNLGDEVKYFEIKMRQVLHTRDFQGKKNFIVKLEDLASTFVSQVITSFNK